MNFRFVERFDAFYLLVGFLAMGFAKAFREQQKTGSKHPVSKLIFDSIHASLQKMMNSISAAGGGF